MYGSLVCISGDDFQTDFKFAVVCDRDEETLRQFLVGVRFEGSFTIDFAGKYKMVESPAFFEAYKHVMAALQVWALIFFAMSKNLFLRNNRKAFSRFHARSKFRFRGIWCRRT